MHFEIIVCLSHFLISGSGGPKYKVLCANLMTPSEGLGTYWILFNGRVGPSGV